jgi:hypothetical protein
MDFQLKQGRHRPIYIIVGGKMIELGLSSFLKDTHIEK